MPVAARTKSKTAVSANAFRRSASLEQDHGEGATLSSFILTACARRTLDRLIAGLADSSNQRAWTLTGPYGTGKSSFCLFLAALLSPAGLSSVSAREMFKAVDPESAAVFERVFPIRRGLVPVLLTGSRESIPRALVRAIAGALRAAGSRTASRLAVQLEGLLNGKTPVSLTDLERGIDGLVRETSGARGAVIIIDELGKFLEYSASNPSQSDVYFLQQLAERASRSGSTLSVIGVLHQDFSGYAKSLSPAEQQEWEKIRGRFEDIAFEQTAEDMVRLIADALHRDTEVPVRNDSAPNGTRAEHDRLCLAAAAVAVPSSAPQHRGNADLFNRCYPLHPFVAALLGPVFKRFGQNERSAFSFLRSREPFGLPDFAARSRESSVYRIVDLYQYLVAVFGDSLLASKDGRRWAEAFNVEAQHPSLSSTESEVLRTIALLGIAGRWHGVPPTLATIVLAVAPGVSLPDVESAIQSLLAKSAIVHRKFNDTFSLWEGSDIDIEGRIADARTRFGPDASIARVIRGIFAPRPLVARRHSFEGGTLRYFDVLPVTPKSLDDTLDLIRQSTSDGHVLVLMPDSSVKSGLSAEQTASALTAMSNVLLCIPSGTREVEGLAHELAAIQWLERETPELQNDATARRELVARREEIRRRLDVSLSDLLAPRRAGSGATRWIRAGEELKIRSQRELNEWLSRICDELFVDCPTIQNEIINRRELSSSAAAAQGDLLKAMLGAGDKEDLGIEGTPPEKSIYLSVLKRLGLHQKRDTRWEFAAGLTGVQRSAKPMMKAIKGFFDQSQAEAKPLSSLFAILSSPPLGIREGVIPIIVCAALLSHEADVALYEDGAFLPQITGPVLEKLVKQPAQYSVRRWHVDGVRTAVFAQLAEMLGQSSVSDRIEQRDLLDVVKPLIRFARRLNGLCQHTRRFSPAALAVREALLGASDPDQLLFKQLPEACGITPFSGRKGAKDTDVQEFRKTLQNALAELQKGYDTLLQSLSEELGSVLEASPHPRGIRGALTHRAAQVLPIALSSELKVLCGRLADSAVEEVAWIESVASFLANKHPSQWIDEDRARFSLRLEQLTHGFRALESLVIARKQDGRTEVDESIQLAVVGSAFPQSQQVVHISPPERERVAHLESELNSIVAGHRHNGDRRILLAALAGVVRTVLTDDAEVIARQEITP